MPEDKKMARILVLEDFDSRVEWLRSVLRRSQANIEWYKKVEPFLEAAKTDHDFVILDHDLDFLHYTNNNYLKEAYPPSGTDACREYDPQRKVPVLIWSQNPDGAKRMEWMLKQKGIPVTRVAFEKENLERLAKALRRMFE